MAKFRDLTSQIEDFIKLVIVGGEIHQVDCPVLDALNEDYDDEMLGSHDCELLRLYWIEKSEFEDFIGEELDDEQNDFYVVEAEYFTVHKVKRSEDVCSEEQINHQYSELIDIFDLQIDAVDYMMQYYKKTV